MTIKTTPPLSYNKPLPSPPIAQIVDPASPPKAQRTLVDAEAGSPSEGVWPILQPENVSPSEPLATSTSDGLPQRSVSEGSALTRNGIPVLKSRITASLFNKNHTSSQQSDLSARSYELSHERFRQMTEPRTFNSMNTYAEPFHAFSTNSEVAIDSPLAHNQRASPVVIVPPRISSKRSSLPSPDTAPGELPAAPFQPARSGSTQCSVFEVKGDYTSNDQANNEVLRDIQWHPTTQPEEVEPVSVGSATATQSHRRSVDSSSTWSLGTSSLLKDEPELDYEGTVRVKRLSWHSSNPDSGPTLRISADADAVLLGRAGSIPAVPALPEHMLRDPSQERSLSTLAGQVSKHITNKMGPTTGSCTSTPSSTEAEAETETETTGSRPIRITPIRSMQPPRKSSTGDLFTCPISPAATTPIEVADEQEVLELSRMNINSSFEVLQETPLSQIKFDAADHTSNRCQKHNYVCIVLWFNLHEANKLDRDMTTTQQHMRMVFLKKLCRCQEQRLKLPSQQLEYGFQCPGSHPSLQILLCRSQTPRILRRVNRYDQLSASTARGPLRWHVRLIQTHLIFHPRSHPKPTRTGQIRLRWEQQGW